MRTRDKKGRFLRGGTEPLSVRFVNKIQFTEGCWLWKGAKNSDGYGFIKDKGKMLKAARVAFELFNGPIPKGKLVRHTCDNPPCVRPTHLLLGTHKDNTGDMMQRGRNFKDYKSAQRLGAAVKKRRTLTVVLPIVLEEIRFRWEHNQAVTMRALTAIPGYLALLHYFTSSELLRKAGISRR